MADKTDDSLDPVRLDTLSDHDLLVRIATVVERIPDLERRMRDIELEIARLKTWAPVIAALITAAAVIISAVLR